MQVIWTDPALERVDETAVYIARDDPAAADRWTLELFAAVERPVDLIARSNGCGLTRRSAAWRSSRVAIPLLILPTEYWHEFELTPSSR
jgi:plasmid stabilization system protein ParE